MIDHDLPPARLTGFTLIEAVVVLALIGALFAVSSLFIARPFLIARELSQRAEMVDGAQTALYRITREVRSALPNSLRVDASGQALEFLRLRLAGRYRAALRPDGGGDPLTIAGASDSFDVLGGTDCSEIETREGAGRDCADGSGDCLVLYNTGYDVLNEIGRAHV